MNNRRTLLVVLNDGESYTLSERDKRDCDFAFYQDRMKRAQLRVIQDAVPDREMQLSLLLAEMKRIYNAEELAAWAKGDMGLQYEAVLNSLRVKHPDMVMERLHLLVRDDEVNFLTHKLNLLEAPEGDTDKQDGASVKKKRHG